MKLSIITINYNNCEGLQKTIDSVIAQTWRDFEWIVIDGGSTDGSKELLEQYKEHFSYWCSEPDKGIYNAMNKGIAKANGDYLNFMNSGDAFYEKKTLERVFSEERNDDILYGDWEQIYNEHTKVMHYPSPINIYAMYRRNICHQAMFIRSIMLKEYGYDESYHLFADYARNTDALLYGASFDYLGIVICKYDMSGLSSILSVDNEIEINRIREKYSQVILLTLQYLDSYEFDRAIQRTKGLVNRGGVIALLTKAFLKIMDKMFLGLNFGNNQFLS